MALIALEGAGLWVPSIYPDLSESAATFILDASGEFAALILRCPRAGTLDRFDAYVNTVTNSPDNGLRFSFQGVSLTTGLPDGTILGATNNATVTYAHTVTTGWKATNFSETVEVTRNQLIACVIDIPVFTAGDSVAMRSISGNPGVGLPYGVSAISTKQATILPLIALHYTDGYAAIAPFLFAFQSAGSLAFHVNTAVADEWGLGFQVPWPCALNAARIQMLVAAGADFEVILYDADGSTALATSTYDGDATAAAAWRFFDVVLQTAVTLLADTTYRVAIRPTTTGTITLAYLIFNSAAHMNTMGGGDNFYMTSRLNQAGAWTDYNSGTFRRPHIQLEFSAFDDGVSAGGDTGSSNTRFNAGFN